MIRVHESESHKAMIISVMLSRSLLSLSSHGRWKLCRRGLWDAADEISDPSSPGGRKPGTPGAASPSSVGSKEVTPLDLMNHDRRKGAGLAWSEFPPARFSLGSSVCFLHARHCLFFFRDAGRCAGQWSRISDRGASEQPFDR